MVLPSLQYRRPIVGLLADSYSYLAVATASATGLAMTANFGHGTDGIADDHGDRNRI